jgi:catechol 2,3-dioxygenase-like lactoylglutathione lyase family enzyme
LPRVAAEQRDAVAQLLRGDRQRQQTGPQSATSRHAPAPEVTMFERYAFVALTTQDLRKARAFWVDLLGCPATEERDNEYFIVDAGGLRLCVDREDGGVHRAGSSDPTIGLKVQSAAATLAELVNRGLTEEAKIISAARGAYVVIHDPEGRCVILTEAD